MVLKEGAHDTKFGADYTVWTVGTGGATGFTMYGLTAENNRIEATDPWGRSTIVWDSVPGPDASYDGGWQTTSFSIDNTKLYRYSVWVHRTVLGTSGRFYFGCFGYGSTNGVYDVATSTLDTNPYFWASSSTPTTNDLPDEWILVVGHIFPYNYGLTVDHSDSGRWYFDGTFKNTGGSYNRDYKWHSATTTARHRNFLYGSTDLTVRQRYCYPRIDLVDGSEPSINDLFTGDFYEAQYFNYIGKNKLVYSPNFSEVGPVDKLINYWPMNGNLLDYGGSGNDGTATGATVVSGLAPRDKDCYEFLTSTDKVDLDTSNPILCNAGVAWSWSAWIYKASYSTHGIAGNDLDGNGVDPGGAISFTANNNMRIDTTTNTDNTIAISTVWATNTWFHFCVTHTTGNLFTFYNNGASVGSETVAGDIDVSRLGDAPDNEAYTSLTGYMFDFRIYNKVLTVPEINILAKTFDTDASNRTEMEIGPDAWYTFGQFKEQL